MPSIQKPGLSTKWSSVHDGGSCKMQAKRDYSTAVLHMVSLLQEKYSTALVQDWVQCYFKKKQKNHLFMSLGVWKRWKFTFFPLLVLPQKSWSIKSTLQRYNWRPVPGFMSFWLSKRASIVPLGIDKNTFFFQGTVVKAPIPEYTDKSMKFYIHLKKKKKHICWILFTVE